MNKNDTVVAIFPFNKVKNLPHGKYDPAYKALDIKNKYDILLKTEFSLQFIDFNVFDRSQPFFTIFICR
jgi:hypothetical protein